MKKLIPLISLLLLAAGCSNPSVREDFILESNASKGVYPFRIDMSDSLSSYTVSFYTKADVSKPAHIPLEVKWKSPSGKVYAENVYMPVGKDKGDRFVYRSGIVPPEAGEWRLFLNPADSAGVLRGMGVILEIR